VEDIDGYEEIRGQTITDTLASQVVCFPAMKSENLVELKKLRDAVTAAHAALANLRSPIEYWDHIIVFIIFMKFSLETRREWNKTLGKSKEYASYEQIHDFLTVHTRGLSDTSGREFR